MAQYAYPDADQGTDGNWVDQDDGSSLYAAIDDAFDGVDASTYIKTPDGGSEDICIVRLSDVSTPDSGNAYIKYRAVAVDSGGGTQPNLKLELLQDTTVKATTTNNSVDTSSFTDYIYTISDVSGISDWTDLYMRITMVPNMGSGDLMLITQVYLETQAAGGSSVPIAAIAMNTYKQLGNN